MNLCPGTHLQESERSHTTKNCTAVTIGPISSREVEPSRYSPRIQSLDKHVVDA